MDNPDSIDICPFCGFDHKWLHISITTGLKFEILCTSCLASGGIFDTREACVSRWNERHTVKNPRQASFEALQGKHEGMGIPTDVYMEWHEEQIAKDAP